MAQSVHFLQTERRFSGWTAGAFENNLGCMYAGQHDLCSAGKTDDLKTRRYEDTNLGPNPLTVKLLDDDDDGSNADFFLLD